MQNRAAVPLLLIVLALAVLLIGAFGLGGAEPAALPSDPRDSAAGDAVAQAGDLAAAAAAAAPAAAPERAEVVDRTGATGVRGVVVDAKTGLPLAGVEVVAVKDQPALAPLVDRFRGMFREGMFVDTRAPRRELGRAVSDADGRFEITGLSPGRLVLDGRSDGWFVRTATPARVAMGEIVEGLELRASPGGRLRGVVLGADGAPSPGADVSVRPGLNAFLGQITDRQYRWLDTVTDDQGRFDIPGVPAGNGYTVAVTAPSIALEEVHGVAVQAGQVTALTVQAHQGAIVEGVVLDPDGAPLAGASVAMVYLDISRVLFSADGRAEPLQTDEEGRFRMEHVAAGRVAVVASADGAAPSNIVELAVVDGGVYDDVLLQLDTGVRVTGRVLDDRDEPVAGASVDVRPFERPNDSQFLKVMLKFRRVSATTDESGRFTVDGMTGERLVIEAGKPGYTTALASGVELDDPDLVVRLQRGATVRGRVAVGEGDDRRPITRFRIETRSREIPRDENGDVVAIDASADRRGWRRRGQGGPPWETGRRKRTRQMPEGTSMGDRTLDGNWREVKSADGSFELTGIPPGRVRLRLRADGFLPPASQTIDIAPGGVSDELLFVCGGGEEVSGMVVDESGAPVSDAQVTAYRAEPDEQRRGLRGLFQVDPEDFDFLALSTNQRAAVTNSRGAFTVPALAAGEYRFTARHPDLAKASTKDVLVQAGVDTPPVEIVIDAGGAVEGTVTGLGMRPLADALMVAVSVQAGSMRSSTTDARGYYRIDGLPPGQYAVFKSRLDERADNVPLELMSNMRLKTVTVRRGKTAQLDVHDEGEDGVRVYGVVRENGQPVARALITLLGSDRDGLLGMGVRANAADLQGAYELVGIAPGDYVMQVTRFQGRPVQTTFPIEVPEGLRDHRFDVELPTSSIAGVVVDTRGEPVPGVRVTLGSDESELSGESGLIGMIAQGGLGRARTDEDGAFELRSVAPGTYRLSAGARVGGGPRRAPREGEKTYGEGVLEDVVVDGSTALTGLVVTVPLAGSVTGIVVDGSNVPVANAEIAYTEDRRERGRRRSGNPLLDMIGTARPVRTDANGRFELRGLTPGSYSLRVESEALEAGKLDDVVVQEGLPTEVQLRVVRGATLRVRATNVDKQQIPLGNITLLDGRSKPVVSRLSTFTLMKRWMSNRDTVNDSGWYEFGSVPPDTYTAILREQGEEDIRIVRTIKDGETVEWDIDVALELEARDRARKDGR